MCSRISAQCDELRSMAESVGLEVPQAATLMMEAADTIDRLDAENAKLREDLTFERSENGWAREFLNRMAKHCGTKDCPSLVAYVGQLESESAKLRELVKRMHGHIKDNCDICDGWYCSNFDEDNECCVYDTLVRGLGIEVNE